MSQTYLKDIRNHAALFLVQSRRDLQFGLASSSRNAPTENTVQNTRKNGECQPTCALAVFGIYRFSNLQNVPDRHGYIVAGNKTKPTSPCSLGAENFGAFSERFPENQGLCSCKTLTGVLQTNYHNPNTEIIGTSNVR